MSLASSERNCPIIRPVQPSEHHQICLPFREGASKRKSRRGRWAALQCSKHTYKAAFSLRALTPVDARSITVTCVTHMLNVLTANPVMFTSAFVSMVFVQATVFGIYTRK